MKRLRRIAGGDIAAFTIYGLVRGESCQVVDFLRAGSTIVHVIRQIERHGIQGLGKNRFRMLGAGCFELKEPAKLGRVFGFFCPNNTIVLTHGCEIKKTSSPKGAPQKREIERLIGIKKEYDASPFPVEDELR